MESPSWDWRGAAIDLGLYYDLGRQAGQLGHLADVARGFGIQGPPRCDGGPAAIRAKVGRKLWRKFWSFRGWTDPKAAQAVEVLERGGLVLFPNLPFEIEAGR